MRLFFGLLLVLPLTAQAADLGDLAIRLVGDMIGDAQITAQQSPKASKPKQYCAIVEEYMAVNKMSKRIFGSAWRKLPDAEREQFLTAFQSEIASFFMGRFESYLFDSTIGLPDSVIDKNGKFDVRVEISSSDNYDEISIPSYTSLEFSVHHEDNELFVMDAKFLGVSFVKLKRSEYKKYRRNIPDLTHKILAKLSDQKFPACL